MPRPATSSRIPADRRCHRARGGVAVRVGWGETAAVWLPWLVAPLFVALPIGGCGMGERLRQAAARPIASGAPGQGPVTLVTFDRR
jgi:hypothetical protein